MLEALKDHADTTKLCLVGVAGASRIITQHLHGDLPISCAAVHGGILSLRGHYATDQLYRLENDFEGSYFENPHFYDMNDMMPFIGQWKVPTLISYGDLDFDVDKSQSISLFEAMQRKGIKSRLLRFTQTGNHLTNPDDVRVFYEQQLKWFDETLKN